MDLLKLSHNLFKKRAEGKPFESKDWPSNISLPKDVSSRAKDIEKFTNKNANGQREGSGGWEYAFSALVVMDKIHISKAISGDYGSVQVKHRYGLNPFYKDNNYKVQFEVQFDDRKVKTTWYDTPKIQQFFPHGIIASFHTHPKYYHQDGSFQYTFFSGQDISSVVHGGIPIQGMIAGKHMWLACKTANSVMIPNELLSEASRIEYREGMNAVPNYVKSNFAQFNVPIYFGNVGGSLNRIV